MPNADRPGFMPADRKPSEELLFKIDASNSTNVFVGDVMDSNAAGSVRPAAGSAPTQTIGVVVALYDANNVPVGAPNSIHSTKYLPSGYVGYALIALALPGRRFIGQAITGKTPAAADVFATSDITAGTGDTVTGRSGHELTYTALNTEGQCFILGKVDSPDNEWGEYCKLYFCFNEGQLMGTGKSIGV